MPRDAHLLTPLREGSAGAASGRAQRRVHNALIVVQMALALVLLAGASLFVRTYAGQRGIELGYDTSRLMTQRVYLAGKAYDSAEARSRAVDQIAHAARGAAWRVRVNRDRPRASRRPGWNRHGGRSRGPRLTEGRELTVHYAGVAGRWPETFDLHLVAGRTFHADELRRDAPVALVNAKLAETFWPGANPLGRRFRFADEAAKRVVLGDWRRARHPHREARRKRRDASDGLRAAPLRLHTQLRHRRPQPRAARLRSCRRYGQPCTRSIRRSRSSTSIRWSRCAG